MDEESISEQVRQFILNYIASVAQLEILLLLHANPKQSWSLDAIAREFRIEPGGARLQLAGLCAGGLVQQEAPNREVYRFAPQSPALADATALLAQAYLVRRVSVVALIFAKPSDKIRGFSDAFRLRQDPPNG